MAEPELTTEEAVALVSASVRSLLPFVPEQQARELAGAVLRDLRARGARLTRIGATRPGASGAE